MNDPIASLTPNPPIQDLAAFYNNAEVGNYELQEFYGAPAQRQQVCIKQSTPFNPDQTCAASICGPHNPPSTLFWENCNHTTLPGMQPQQETVTRQETSSCQIPSVEPPYAFVHPSGLLWTVCKHGIVVEMSLDHALRITFPALRVSAAISNTGEISCIHTDSVTVYQEGPQVEISAALKKVKATSDRLVFASGDQCFEICHNQLRLTQLEFTSLSHDPTISLVFSSSGYGPQLSQITNHVVQAASFEAFDLNNFRAQVNGVEIRQTSDGAVTVSWNHRIITMSSDCVRILTPQVQLYLYTTGTTRVSSKNYFLDLSPNHVLVSNRKVQGGFNHENKLFYHEVPSEHQLEEAQEGEIQVDDQPSVGYTTSPQPQCLRHIQASWRREKKDRVNRSWYPPGKESQVGRMSIWSKQTGDSLDIPGASELRDSSVETQIWPVQLLGCHREDQNPQGNPPMQNQTAQNSPTPVTDYPRELGYVNNISNEMKANRKKRGYYKKCAPRGSDTKLMSLQGVTILKHPKSQP